MKKLLLAIKTATLSDQTKIILIRVIGAAIMAVFIKLLINDYGYNVVGKLALIIVSGELLRYLGSFGIQTGIMQIPQALSRSYFDLAFCVIATVVIVIIWFLIIPFFGNYFTSYSLLYACSMLFEEVYVSTLKRAQKPILASSIGMFGNLILLLWFALSNYHNFDILLIFSIFKFSIPLLLLSFLSMRMIGSFQITEIKQYYPFIKKSLKGMTLVPILSISILWFYKNFADINLSEKAFGLFESSFKLGYHYLILIHSGLMIKYHSDTISIPNHLQRKKLIESLQRALVFFGIPWFLILCFHDQIWVLLYSKTDIIDSNITLIITFGSLSYFLSEFIGWSIYIRDNFRKFSSIYLIRFLSLFILVYLIDDVDEFILAQIWLIINLITLFYSLWLFRLIR